MALTKRQSEWLLTGGVWLAAVPGFLGWSWWNVLWIAVPIAAIFLYPKPRRISQPFGLEIGIAVTIFAPLLIAAILFGIGRMAASSFGI